MMSQPPTEVIFKKRATVQFRVHCDGWIKEVKMHFFTGLASIWRNIKYIHKFQQEKDLFITLSIVYMFLRRGEKRSTSRKTSQSKERTNNKLNPKYM